MYIYCVCMRMFVRVCMRVYLYHNTHLLVRIGVCVRTYRSRAQRKGNSVLAPR